MTIVPRQHAARAVRPGDSTTLVLARQLAAAGLGVDISRRRDTCQLTITGVQGGKSFLALDPSGRARWYYEPATGPATSPATLTAIITYLLRAPQDTASAAAYRA